MSAFSSPKNGAAEGGRHHVRLEPLAEDESAAGGRPAVAGVVPFSSVDWPGQLAAVIFIGGCPWRCHYCHNRHLQQRHATYDWPGVLTWLETRRGLLDGVVFSGGEPLSEKRLPHMMAAVSDMGFKIAMHTAGMYPTRLAAVLPWLRWVGLDIKCDAAGYDAITGRRGSARPVDQSLQLLLDADIAFECRTTWSPAWLSEGELLQLASGLAARGVQSYAVQNYRAAPGAAPSAGLSAGCQAQLAALFNRFEYR